MAAVKSKKTAGARASVLAIIGSDEQEVKRAAKEAAAAMAGAGDFGVEVIEGTAGNADEAAARIHAAVDALLTFPFLGGEKLVWLKNADFLVDARTGGASAVLEALEKLGEVLEAGLPEGVRFLLTGEGIDKRRAFYKLLQKVGKVEEHAAIDTTRGGWEEHAALLARQLAQERGLDFEDAALELFAMFTGGDRRIMVSELEKLDLYLGPERRVASLEDIRALTPMSRAGVVFELGNAIAERQLRRALDLLDMLLFQKETPVGMMQVAIIPTVRNLLLMKDLMTRHRLSRPAQPFFFGKTLEKLPASATAHLPRKKDGTLNAYALGLAAAHAHRYEIEELKEALHAVLETSVRLVSSQLDPQIVLSELLVRIIGQQQGNARR